MYFLLAKRTICYTSTFETEKDLYVYSTHVQHKEKWLDYDITDVDYLISICHTHTYCSQSSLQIKFRRLSNRHGTEVFSLAVGKDFPLPELFLGVREHTSCFHEPALKSSPWLFVLNPNCCTASSLHKYSFESLQLIFL